MPYADRDAQRAYVREWIKSRRRSWFAENGPCVDCGTWNDLQVDHVDAAQKVTHRVWSWAKERREAELAKCVPRCRACHLAKTKAGAEFGRHLSGEAHPRGKLTEDAVRDIRSSDLSGYALSQKYGVNSGTISLVRRRLTWKHVE